MHHSYRNLGDKCFALLPCYSEGMYRLNYSAYRTYEHQIAHRRKSRHTIFPYTISRSLQLTNCDCSECILKLQALIPRCWLLDQCIRHKVGSLSGLEEFISGIQISNPSLKVDVQRYSSKSPSLTSAHPFFCVPSPPYLPFSSPVHSELAFTVIL